MKGLTPSVFALTFILALFIAGCGPAYSADEEPTFVRVPIFFLTDRNLAGDPSKPSCDFGEHRKYLGDCLHDPFSGTASVVIKNVDRKPITDALKAIGWSAVNTDKLRSYSSDENNVEWSQEHFKDMLESFDKISKEDPEIKFRLMAHSMGSRLPVRAIPFSRDRKYICEFTMICPDVDSGLVKHYARRYFNPNGTAKIRLYMSRHDKALPMSQIVHGGYTRLGETADSLSGMLNQVMSTRFG